MIETFTRWKLGPDDLANLTPVKARDLVTRCLLEAQRETFAQNEQRLGHRAEDKDLVNIVEGMVRLAFREGKQDYDNPTRQGLMQVVETLGRKSAGWGTPAEIIEYHKQQIGRVLQNLK